MFQTIGITTRRDVADKENFCKLISYLLEQGKEVRLSSHARDNLDGHFPELEDIDYSKPFDLLIAFGGDGTILRAARHIMDPKKTCILGINAGHLGFLAAIREEDWLENLPALLEGEHLKVRKRAIQLKLVRDGKELINTKVLNDAVVAYKNVARLVSVHAKVQNRELCTYRADGVIVSTPTGSTAYNLAAGGPIVYPSLTAMIVTPICSFSLTQKPIVLPGDRELTLTFEDNDEVLNLTMDGQRTFELEQGDKLSLVTMEEPIVFIKQPDDNYFNTIREKLHWGETLR